MSHNPAPGGTAGQEPLRRETRAGLLSREYPVRPWDFARSRSCGSVSDARSPDAGVAEAVRVAVARRVAVRVAVARGVVVRDEVLRDAVVREVGAVRFGELEAALVVRAGLVVAALFFGALVFDALFFAALDFDALDFAEPFFGALSAPGPVAEVSADFLSDAADFAALVRAASSLFSRRSAAFFASRRAAFDRASAFSLARLTAFSAAASDRSASFCSFFGVVFAGVVFAMGFLSSQRGAQCGTRR